VLRVYNYWLYDIPSRAIDITFGRGTTRAAGFPPYGSYAFEPLPESGDTVVSRETKIVGCDDAETAYGGAGWTRREGAAYYHGALMESGTAGASVQISFRGSSVYWRAVADTAGGKADVTIDGTPAGIADTYYRDELPDQFAFVRTGLDPRALHTFRAVVRGDRNPLSAGTLIRHMAFEYGAESYRASAGFSAVEGKNNWHYADAGRMRFIDFVRTPAEAPGGKERKTFANEWRDATGGGIGGAYQVCGTRPVSRTWIAPHGGSVRVEGTVGGDPAGVRCASITCNGRTAWSAGPPAGGQAAAHDITIAVSPGDAIRFTLVPPASGAGTRVTWDPVVTYVQ